MLIFESLNIIQLIFLKIYILCLVLQIKLHWSSFSRIYEEISLSSLARGRQNIVFLHQLELKKTMEFIINFKKN